MARLSDKIFSDWPLYLLGLLCLFAIIVDYQVARTMFRWADDLEIYNQLLAVENGNLLLDHWVLAVDNYYLDELPIYLFLRSFLGDPLGLVVIAPTLVFALIILAAFGLVWQSIPTARCRIMGLYLVFLSIALPISPGMRWVLRSAYHNNTILFALMALNLIADVFSAGRFNRFFLFPLFLIMFVASSSDPFFNVFFLGPLLAFIALRAAVARRIRVDEAGIFLCAIAAVIAGVAFTRALADHHGFVTEQIFSADFVHSYAELVANFFALLSALCQLFGAAVKTSGHGVLAHMVALVRMPLLGGMAVIVSFIGWSIWRSRPVAVMAQFLMFAAACLFCADLFSELFAFTAGGSQGNIQSAARFVVPIAIFLAIAVAIEGPKWLLERPLAGWRVVVAGYVVLLCCLQLTAAAVFCGKAMNLPSFIERMPLSASVVPWLEQGHFTFGVGDYWTAIWIGAVSHLQVQATPVRFDNSTVVVNHWLCDDSALAAGRAPQFAIVPEDGNDFRLTVANLSAAYGKPERILDIGGYIILVFRAP